jgi:hypothetical protein
LLPFASEVDCQDARNIRTPRLQARLRGSSAGRTSAREATRNRTRSFPGITPLFSLTGKQASSRRVPCRFDVRSYGRLCKSVHGRAQRNLWTDQARGPATPRSPSRNGFACFFPLPRSGGIPREAKKPSTAVLRCAAGLTAGRSLPGARTAIEAAMVAARKQNGDHHGCHRKLHRRGQRLHRIGQDAHAQHKS